MPRVVELEEGSKEGSETRSLYIVESPTGSPIHEKLHVSPGPEGCNQYQKLTRVDERAMDRMKKRNFEGLLKGIDKERVQAGVQKMVRVAASLADRSTPRGRLMLGNGAGA
ncbi:uncharacterized protein [Triticum aestivum]|uniref:uncharacterized protein n=1 Tax=Triticum aestivum TaxID=4565 RepID=UPI001D026D63|nr:uncharacterized protein LOC123134462 [Triticum aestivum]